MLLRRALVITGLIVLGVILVGCGRDRGPERVIVSGTVNYRGRPIPTGIIRFVPKGSTPSSGAQIIDGKYRADSHGGVPVGVYGVSIEAYTSESAAAATGPDGPPPEAGPTKQYLPKKYNAGTTIEITIPSGSRPIVKDFDLTD
jgi:hypothetical protein